MMNKSQKQIFNGKELEALALKSRIRQSCTLPLLISTFFGVSGQCTQGRIGKRKCAYLKRRKKKILQICSMNYIQHS